MKKPNNSIKLKAFSEVIQKIHSVTIRWRPDRSLSRVRTSRVAATILSVSFLAEAPNPIAGPCCFTDKINIHLIFRRQLEASTGGSHTGGSNSDGGSSGNSSGNSSSSSNGGNGGGGGGSDGGNSDIGVGGGGGGAVPLTVNKLFI